VSADELAHLRELHRTDPPGRFVVLRSGVGLSTITIAIDGSEVGTLSAGADFELDLPPGRYRLRATTSFFVQKPYDGVIEITPGRRTVYKLSDRNWDDLVLEPV
jgi:hypothetical protein